MATGPGPGTPVAEPWVVANIKTSAPASPIPVLVVDDDPASAKLVAAALAGEGFATHVARSAEEALLMIEHVRPRAAVVDLVLPRMGGLVFVEQLRARPEMRAVPIIAMSAFNGPESERLALAAGCVAYLRKPIDPISLPALLRTHLKGTP